MRRRPLLGSALALLGAGAPAGGRAIAQPVPGAEAEMLPDRTLRLRLGPLGSGLPSYRFPPTSPEYAAVLRWLAPLRPGDRRPLPATPAPIPLDR